MNQTATKAWLGSIQQVLNEGKDYQPRGMKTKEILNQVVEFDMNYPVCHHPVRRLSYKFMAAEAYWITSGSPLVEDIAPYNDHISQFSDDEYIFNGAYGPAFLSQVNYVVNTLKKDIHTRQAVMTIWHPNPIDSKDQKCTVSLIFNIRDGQLHTTVTMRSNDLQLGRPYDMFNFTVMTLRILTKLNETSDELITLGKCTLHGVSSHIYEDKMQLSRDMMKPALLTPAEHMPWECFEDWNFVVKSLLACRDMTDTTGLWKIRP